MVEEIELSKKVFGVNYPDIGRRMLCVEEMLNGPG